MAGSKNVLEMQPSKLAYSCKLLKLYQSIKLFFVTFAICRQIKQEILGVGNHNFANSQDCFHGYFFVKSNKNVLVDFPKILRESTNSEKREFQLSSNFTLKSRLFFFSWSSLN